MWKFVLQHFHLAAYFRSPGDGRASHKISAKDLLWSIVLGTILRHGAFLAIEALVGSKARKNLSISRTFGDDALGYFTERLDPAPTRAALAAVLHRAKRNKAFEDCHFVGLALDGTTGGRRRKKGCPLCRPHRNTEKEILGYRHHLVLAAVVGGRAVEDEVKRCGFSVIRALGGHGIGRTIHEAPSVPNYFEPLARQRLTPGLVITVEPIIAMGKGLSFTASDGWTERTVDGSLSAHFEHTIVITSGAPVLLTAAA